MVQLNVLSGLMCKFSKFERFRNGLERLLFYCCSSVFYFAMARCSIILCLGCLMSLLVTLENEVMLR